MIRFIISGFLMVLLFMGNLFQTGVTATITAPDSVKAGQDFTVNVVLEKGSLTGFSRFLQDLPAGLTASSENSANAEFTFDENKVRLIWMKLPDQNSISFSYKVSVYEILKGQFTIGGKFSYIENNERKTVELPVKTINIIPSPNVNPADMVDINNYGSQTVVQTTNPQNDSSSDSLQKIITASSISQGNISGKNQFYGNVVCVRQKPEKSSSAQTSGYLVNLLVNKGKMDKYAKIEEQIPAGFKAISLETESGMFTFDEQTARILWLKLPDKPSFVVSYLLVPDENNTKAPVMVGQLSYIVNNKSYVTTIVERTENLKTMAATDVQKMVALIIKTGGKTTQSTVIAAQYKTPYIKPVKVVRHTESFRSYFLEPESGVYYRVQLAAGHHPIHIRSYFRRLRIVEDVRTEEHDGWYKYSVGSFTDYKQARDYRVKVWSSSLAKDAFISAYNNGSRITVQEALMVSNQHWLK